VGNELAPVHMDAHRATAVVTSGQDASSRVILVPFEADVPETIVKVSPAPKFNRFTEHEHKTLREIRAHLDDSMRATLPTPLSSERCGTLAVACETSVRGTSIWVSSGCWARNNQGKMQDLRLAADWLVRFHKRANLGTSTWDDEAQRHWIGRTLSDYREIFGCNAREEQLFSEVLARAGELRGRQLPSVWQHNDFGPWNINRAGQTISVIDWESARPGLPLCDLIYFVTYWSFVVRRAHGEAAELRAFAELWSEPFHSDPYLRSIRETIAAYLDALEIDSRFLPVLLAHVWAERAVERFRRQQVVGGAQANPRFANRFVDYVNVLARSEIKGGLPARINSLVKTPRVFRQTTP
jgi:hypothetical protein